MTQRPGISRWVLALRGAVCGVRSSVPSSLPNCILFCALLFVHSGADPSPPAGCWRDLKGHMLGVSLFLKDIPLLPIRPPWSP